MNPPTTPPSKKRAYSTPSPDVIRSSSSQIAARYDTSSAGNSVVKNARKRLRGDALSPSPNRFDKKWRSTSVRRSTGLQSALPAYNTDTPKNDLEPDISYVDESPVKSISNGKDFKLLFEEERLPKLDFSKKNGAVSQSRSFFVPLDGRIKGGSPEIILDGKGGAAKMVEIRGQDKVITTSNKAENMKASLRPNFTYGKQSCNSVSTLTQDSILVTREEDGKGAGFSSTNRKRSSSEDASGLRNEEQSFVDLTDKLIPPSPPSTAVGAHEERSKGTNKTRKRVKLLADKTIEDYSTDDENDIRIIDFDQQSRRNNGDSRVSVSDEGDDTETRIGLSRIAEDVVYDGDELEINLPDDLRKVLYISSSRARDREERTIVESLLRGGPEYRNERGEIWGIGEVEDATSTITDGEDDWAGEGVPWEAGEL
ncbi:hypothetical protein EW145_g1524 [Phellinidium pouzarii]|uniref:Uncharacterized protein n=1 Tax=Phellinidium pouzarii TaxID=167371 RepID=A0A4V3XDL1_9AGAM|nr:hypothetical protein EW145_g1524 [Phellinidium pouzarii]